MIKEHERVALMIDLPEHRLKTGDVGTVVHVHNMGEAYEVEFLALDSRTSVVATVTASQLCV